MFDHMSGDENLSSSRRKINDGIPIEADFDYLLVMRLNLKFKRREFFGI